MSGHELDDAPSIDEFANRRADQDRTLAAMHALEGALGSAAPGREQQWRRRVVEALDTLKAVVEAEDANSRAPDSLLSDIGRNHQRLRSRVHGVRAQYANLREALVKLGSELEVATEATTDFADLRERVAWLLSALRHQRARESDLLYEAYRDAFGVDIEDEVKSAPPVGAPDELHRLTTRRAARARSLDALRHAERRAATPSSGREGDWLEALRASAHELEVALLGERSDDDLFADIEVAQPRLHRRIDSLRHQYRELADAVRTLGMVLDDSDPESVDVADVRRTLDQLATELRYLRARETDLVFEAYTVDLGAGD